MTTFITALVLAVSTLPWWPGGGRYDVEPVYEDRVPVINTYGPLPKLRGAIRDWNACDSRLHLYQADLAAFTPKTITIFLDPPGDQEAAYGGWNGTAGIVALGDAWTRTLHVISHEIGHALGFAHTASRRSVMSDAPRVTTLDCRGLRNYY